MHTVCKKKERKLLFLFILVLSMVFAAGRSHAEISPAIGLYGPQQIEPHQQYKLKLHLEHVTFPILAQDLTIQYDAALFRFVEARPAEGIHVIADKVSQQQVRLLLISLGEEEAIASAGPILELVWEAKPVQRAFFAPNSFASRAEAVTMLLRFIDAQPVR